MNGMLVISLVLFQRELGMLLSGIAGCGKSSRSSLVGTVRDRSSSQEGTADLRGSARMEESAELAEHRKTVARLSLICWHLLLVVFGRLGGRLVPA